MIVVDTNVVLYLVLPSGSTVAAKATLARDPEWAAPLLWRSELRNALATYVRRGDVMLEQALEAQSVAEGFVRHREYHVNSAMVLELAVASGRSAYDCEFVALSRSLGVPLITADRQLLRSFPDTAVSLNAFANPPAGGA